ncbi:MAG: hypothetical protein IJR99_01000 [Kiritimatiellae bacterium]|nr:hypothetical protein [Kiritimatiellia bacterium]
MKPSCLFGLVLATFFSAQAGMGSDRLDFSFSTLHAGRATLSENGFAIVRRLQVADFAPELQIPVELVYSSARTESGLIGYAWRIPQLESTTLPASDGMVWITPWGEEIKFYSPSKVSDEFKEVFQGDPARRQAYFAPYADWEATPLEKDARRNGNWRLTGIRAYKGWGFLYRDAKLQEIKTPCGRSVQFRYAKGGVLKSVSQDDVPFLEIQSDSGEIDAITANGVHYKFVYETVTVPVLPQTLAGRRDLKLGRKMLRHCLPQGLPGTSFQYDGAGYLSWISQDGKKEEFTVESESLEERITNLSAKQKKEKSPVEKISGRLLADGRYLYRYKGTQPGYVELTDRGGGVTTYDFSAKAGTLSVTVPSGQKTTVYYYMRHDVPYLGKIRKVVDSRGRELASYRYDSKTGKISQVRNRLGNDVNFTHDENGGLLGVSRQARNAKAQEQILAVRSDASGNPLEIAILDEKGKAVQTTRIDYGKEGMPTRIDDGRGAETYLYSKSGYPVRKTDRFGLVTRIEYDRYNRVRKVSTPDGYDTVITRTPEGFVSRVERRDESGVCASVDITYDSHGVPVRYMTEDGKMRSFERDPEGRIVRDHLPDGTIFSYAYDATGKLVSVLDPDGGKRSIEHSQNGITRIKNAEDYITDYLRHKDTGLVERIISRLSAGKSERRYAYDPFDRLVKADSGKEGKADICYDEWGRVSRIVRDGRRADYRYNFLGALTGITDGDVEETCQYNVYGQRVSRITRRNNTEFFEKREYDQLGRLVSIQTKDGRIDYAYDSKSKLASQRIGKYLIRYTYTPHGELATKKLYSSQGKELGSLAYRYRKDGRIIGRSVNGMRQDYVYDKMDRLVSVWDASGNCMEQYSYDRRGNILEKVVDGKRVTFAYNHANQLIRKSYGKGKTVEYKYDASGRLIREGDRTYTYNDRNKVTAVFEDGKCIAAYSYTVSGQIDSIIRGNQTEDLIWDGLALIGRNGESIVNEPHPNGGSPILIGTDTVLFTDILGTTVGLVKNGEYKTVPHSVYGESTNTETFFTGKPFIDELGYSFLLRNYRPELARWQNPDPLGFPDGWNNYVYCNGMASFAFDLLGGALHIVDQQLFPFATAVENIEYSYSVLLYGVCNHDYDAPSITPYLELINSTSEVSYIDIETNRRITVSFSYGYLDPKTKIEIVGIGQKRITVSGLLVMRVTEQIENLTDPTQYSIKEIDAARSIATLRCTISKPME